MIKKFVFLVILTQTIGLTTDDILCNEVGTQTARPKTSLSFTRFPYKNIPGNRHIFGTIDNTIMQNVRILQAQAQDIKKLEEQLRKKRNNTHTKPEDVAVEPDKNITDDPRELEFSDDSLCGNEKTDFRRDNRSLSTESYDILVNDVQENFLSAPTLTSWTGFDSTEDDDYDLPELPKRTISEGCAPWSNFKDVLIGNR